MFPSPPAPLLSPSPPPPPAPVIKPENHDSDIQHTAWAPTDTFSHTPSELTTDSDATASPDNVDIVELDVDVDFNTTNDYVCVWKCNIEAITVIALLLLHTSVYIYYIQGGPKKWHILFENFGKSAPILSILSLLQQFC